MKKLENKNDLQEGFKCYLQKGKVMQEYAMVTLMYSSGMGVNDICNLTSYDFLVSVSEYFYNTEICPFCYDEVYSHLRCRDDVIGLWEMYNIKRDSPYVTFCTAEATHAILDWLYIKNYEHIYLNEPLFTGPDGEAITRNDVYAIFEEMQNHSGISIRSIDLRRLFNETLQSSNVPQEYIKLFLGHDPYPDSYFNIMPDMETLRYEYTKAATELSLFQSEISGVKGNQICLDILRSVLY